VKRAGADVVLRSGDDLIERVRALAPRGVDHIVEVAFGGGVDRTGVLRRTVFVCYSPCRASIIRRPQRFRWSGVRPLVAATMSTDDCGRQDRRASRRSTLRAGSR
jgi:hypothetical protein